MDSKNKSEETNEYDESTEERGATKTGSNWICTEGEHIVQNVDARRSSQWLGAVRWMEVRGKRGAARKLPTHLWNAPEGLRGITGWTVHPRCIATPSCDHETQVACQNTTPAIDTGWGHWIDRPRNGPGSAR